MSMQVRLGAGENVENALKHGDLIAEIVNIGQHRLYIKSVSLSIAPQDWSFQPETAKPNTALDPGAAIYYRLSDSDLAKHPLDSPDDPSQRENYVVIVNSNKAEIFRAAAAVSSFLIYGGRRAPARLPVPSGNFP